MSRPLAVLKELRALTSNGVIYNGSDERKKVLGDILEYCERDGSAGGDKLTLQ